MTPIKSIGWFETLVFTVDFTGQVTLVAAAASEKHAEWLAWSLGQAHNVPAEKSDGMPIARFIVTD